MSFGAVASVGIAVGGSLLANRSANGAAKDAGEAQSAAAQQGIDEISGRYDEVSALLAPYSEGGAGAYSQLLALTGASGQEAYQAQVDNVRNGAEYQSLLSSGEESILANASATGGLRGGNTQGALAQFAPQLLQQQLDQRFNRLGGIANTGLNAAQSQSQASLQAGGNIAQLFGQQGAAQAGVALARGQNNANLIGDVTGLISGGIQGGF